MTSNVAEYKPFTRYIIIWIVYVLLTLTYPNMFSTKIYAFVGLVYLIFTHILYEKKTCAYLVSNYPTECINAMARRYPPDAFDGENFKKFMSLVAFNQGYRRRIFDRSDVIIRKIYYSNISKVVFSDFLCVTAFLSFGFNFWL